MKRAPARYQQPQKRGTDPVAPPTPPRTKRARSRSKKRSGIAYSRVVVASVRINIHDTEKSFHFGLDI
jgi:hypothetical protein